VQDLVSLEPDELTAFSIDRSETAYYDVDSIQQIESVLARFPSLASVEVPWERPAPAPAS